MQAGTSVQSGRKPRTWDIYILAGLFAVGALAEFLMIFLKAERGVLFFGAVWVEEPYVNKAAHAMLGVYYAVAAVGVYSLRPYGYWMVVILLGVCITSTAIGWFWGRDVAMAHGCEPTGPIVWGCRLLFYAIYAYWCWARRRLGKRGKGDIPGTHAPSHMKATRAVLLILGVTALLVASLAALPFVVFAVDWLFVKLLRIIFQA